MMENKEKYILQSELKRKLQDILIICREERVRYGRTQFTVDGDKLYDMINGFKISL